MHHVSLEEARDQLATLVHEAAGGDEVILTDGDQPVARIVAFSVPRAKRTAGSARGLVRIGHDFDAPLDDFADYR
jgi:antitoxin (DNA-binding transcriptional repressor) of toxin-antitoxin stability system